MVTNLKIKVDYIEKIQEYHIWYWNKNKWHFWYNIKPCDNMKLFLKLLERGGVLFELKEEEDGKI